jgi:hypothetical protein
MHNVQSDRPGGRPELWLAGFHFGAALAIAAFVGALTQSDSMAGIRDVLWTLTATGIIVLLLCLAGYLSQRKP